MRMEEMGFNNKKSKKGQEEIMGFMLIVVMIIVIGLGLIFFLKPSQNEEKNLQTENLLYKLGHKNILYSL